MRMGGHAVQEVMVDAVTAEDGQTYSLASIQAWFDTGARRSPMTNLEIGTALTPNLEIRSLVRSCLAHSPDLVQ